MACQISTAAVALRFNEFINRRELGRLAASMTEDHVMTDAEGTATGGRAVCEKAWADFFALFPDYQSSFDRVLLQGKTVVMLGRSTCSDPRLCMEAIWVAEVRADKVAQWRIYPDTEENRCRFGLSQEP